MEDPGGGQEWISDYLVSVLKSPTFAVPIAQFLDDRCEIFDDSEENKLQYTTCHNDFKQLVNDLLISHLLEVSVSPEEFDGFCEHGLTNHTQLHRALVERLLSVDDFLTFKAMMAKHNADLNREALLCENVDEEPSSPTQLVADDIVQNSISEGIKGGAGAEWQIYEEQLCSALAASQHDLESLEACQRCEEAELEQVIALSLQLDEERLRLLEESAPGQAELEPAQQPARPPALPASAGHYSSPLQVLPPKPRLVEVAPLVPARPRGGTWGFTSAPLCPRPLSRSPCEATPSVASGVPPTANGVQPEPSAPAPTGLVHRAFGFTSSPLCRRPPHLQQPQTAQAAPPEPPPVEPPVVELGDMRDNLQRWRERAERAITVRAQTKPRPVQVQAAAVSAVRSIATGPTDEERQQRAEHLARQRDRLRQKRQLEREQQVAEFPRGRGAAAGASSGFASAVDRASAQAAAAAEGRRWLAARSPSPAPEGAPAPDPVVAERMRKALTLQLRQTLVRSTVSDAGVLEGQLSQLETLKKAG